MTKGQVADAVKGNWVDHSAPEGWRPYLRLSRADRPIGTWLLLIPCWWGVTMAAAATGARWFDLWIVIGCTVGAFLMRGAGCTWNDITDRDFDGSVARTRSRPIPSGQVTVRQALWWMAAQIAVSALILFTLGPVAIAFGIAALVPVAVYPFAKRFTWWPQVFLGIAFNWGVWVAWAAHGAPVTGATLALFLSGIAWTLFYDTIYAHQDKEDDALIGVKSTARLFGASTPLWLMAFLILAAGLMAVAAVGSLRGLPLLLALAGCAAFAAHMLWQMRRLDIDRPDVCLTLFRSNRDAGLVAALFLAGAALV
ncbi:4-hydroxybenzoate octaprenyltransferase [Falsirhodobacter sp. 20TX0035]|uniref:4-hydroxybenzoate octaprenyltransferase n=1 Tax=Falsirhodobacter sp. 20TX0035 TaxID=3022019 RepID=UPI0023314EA7|nr:4-hydroxybenzoate octaprenyltransferase [Falsirhodobacter sp. 20TX0035]MDB6452236.1 4-hydroxybenzoate octaprenyltransferase [Falsirhodobacter sp. 20TX0035]